MGVFIIETARHTLSTDNLFQRKTNLIIQKVFFFLDYTFVFVFTESVYHSLKTAKEINGFFLFLDSRMSVNQT